MCDGRAAHEKSVTDWLWELGVTHERDGTSQTDAKHCLYFDGRFIGRYSALDVSILLEKEGFTEAVGKDAADLQAMAATGRTKAGNDISGI